MNLRAQVTIAAAAFVLGAWCAHSRTGGGPPVPRDTGVPPVQPALPSTATEAPPSSEQTLPRKDREEELWSALVSCLHEPAYFRRRAEMAGRLANATSDDIATFIARAEKLPGRFQDMILYSLVSRWFEVDTAAAAKWVRGRNHSTFLPIWAAHDRLAALAAYVEQPARDSFAWDFGGLARIAGNTPAEQVTTLAELPPSETRDILIMQSLFKWAHAEPEAALARASQLPTSGPIAAFQKALLTGDSSSGSIDPAQHLALATRFASEARPGLNGDTFATRFAIRLAAEKVATARQWIGTLPDGLRPAATLGVAREWAKTDAVAALEWTRAQGHDIARNLYTDHTYATGTVLSQAIASNPARTTSWLLAQPAGEQREAWIETAALASIPPLSLEQREKAARTWLRELHTAMPAESRARLTDKLGAQAALLR